MSEEITPEEFKRLFASGRPKKAIKPKAKVKRITGDSAKDYVRLIDFLRTSSVIPTNFETEYPFAKEKGRRHRSDLAWPQHRLALEIDGGVFTGQGHGNPIGILKDQEKGNLYALLRWHVIRVVPDDIETGYVVSMLESWFTNGDLPKRIKTKRKFRRKKR